VEGQERSAHSAFDTLVHILEEGLIRGSNRLTRGPQRVVSFTELLPNRLTSLMTWRTGLARWSFEPYGIAMSKRRLLKLGARKVIYGDEEVYRNLPEDSRHLFQVERPNRQDWSGEKEWRVLGDLSLRVIDPEEVTIIVENEGECSIVRHVFGYPCRTFSGGNP